MALLLRRLDGILSGYRDTGRNKLTAINLIHLNAMIDLEDLARVFIDAPERDGRGHCSALVKNVEGRGLLVGHTTWTGYNTMLRIYKTLSYPHVVHPSIENKQMSFSSYPGYLGSVDDWLVLSPSRLVVTETTNSCLNLDHLKAGVTPESLLTPWRSLIASRMASRGRDWYVVFSRYNSGTQNNQWIVVDYKLVGADGMLADSDVLWIAEQMPGQVVAHDMTQHLKERSYWSSYNAPYFAESRSLAALPGKSYFDSENFASVCEDQRGRLFSDNQASVKNLFDLGNLLRDPHYVWGCSKCALGSRWDLHSDNPDCGSVSAYGSVDAKVADLSTVLAGGSWMITGPPEAPQPFRWSEFPGVVHEGHPDVFDFGWYYFDDSPSAGRKGLPDEDLLLV